jgi:hypothetical protein
MTTTTTVKEHTTGTTKVSAHKRIRKTPPEFLELSPQQRAKIFELAATVRNKITIQGPDKCWVHPVGVLAQTAQPDGLRKSLGKYVWELFHPDDEPLYTGAVGDPMTISVQARPSCEEGCVRPDHLNIMTSAERSKRGRPAGLSKYMGVVEHKQSNSWQARFHANGEMFSGGYFPTDREAAIRYDQISAFVDPERPTNYSMGLLKVVPVPTPANERKLTSSHRGVFWNGPKSRWFARCSINGAQKHIGSFLTEEDAALAYNQFVVDNGLDYPLNELG